MMIFNTRLERFHRLQVEKVQACEKEMYIWSKKNEV